MCLFCVSLTRGGEQCLGWQGCRELRVWQDTAVWEVKRGILSAAGDTRGVTEGDVEDCCQHISFPLRQTPVLGSCQELGVLMCIPYGLVIFAFSPLSPTMSSITEKK